MVVLEEKSEVCRLHWRSIPWLLRYVSLNHSAGPNDRLTPPSPERHRHCGQNSRMLSSSNSATGGPNVQQIVEILHDFLQNINQSVCRFGTQTLKCVNDQERFHPAQSFKRNGQSLHKPLPMARDSLLQRFPQDERRGGTF